MPFLSGQPFGRTSEVQQRNHRSIKQHISLGFIALYLMTARGHGIRRRTRFCLRENIFLSNVEKIRSADSPKRNKGSGNYRTSLNKVTLYSLSRLGG